MVSSTSSLVNAHLGLQALTGIYDFWPLGGQSATKAN
jgi:hypothetical protein